mmetsp:Transcript_21197/g.68579  ORF Transcript_21197/g.68579 Transcript_21197/m.68579 type:complete len:249 (+) Transcript_21197:199-945(+)
MARSRARRCADTCTICLSTIRAFVHSTISEGVFPRVRHFHLIRLPALLTFPGPISVCTLLTQAALPWPTRVTATPTCRPCEVGNFQRDRERENPSRDRLPHQLARFTDDARAAHRRHTPSWLNPRSRSKPLCLADNVSAGIMHAHQPERAGLKCNRDFCSTPLQPRRAITAADDTSPATQRFSRHLRLRAFAPFVANIDCSPQRLPLLEETTQVPEDEVGTTQVIAQTLGAASANSSDVHHQWHTSMA